MFAGYSSEAEARNNSNQWNEECFNEGCDNEEREEMYDNGDFNEETREWSSVNSKTQYQAVFEAAELAHPTSGSATSYSRCTGMMSDFWNRIGKNTSDVQTIWSLCQIRFNNNWHRSH